MTQLTATSPTQGRTPKLLVPVRSWRLVRDELVCARPLMLTLLAAVLCALSTVVASAAQASAMPAMLAVDSLPTDEIFVFLVSNSSPAPLVATLFILVWVGGYVDSGVLARQALLSRKRSELSLLLIIPAMMRSTLFATTSWLSVIGWFHFTQGLDGLDAGIAFRMWISAVTASLIWSMIALAVLLCLHSRAWALVLVLCWFVLIEPVIAGFGSTSGTDLIGSILPGSAVKVLGIALSGIDEPLILASTSPELAGSAGVMIVVWGAVALLVTCMAINRRAI